MIDRQITLKQVPVLLYHHVSPHGFNTVTPRLFERHLDFLQNAGYTAITFRQILDETSLPDKPVVITFDDGYAAIHQYALPLLEKRVYKAVVFMLTGYIGKKNTWDLSLEPSGIRHLKKDELIDLSRYGWEIAAHTISHRILTKMPEKQVRREVEESAAILEDLLNIRTDGFAYPFGRYNERVQKAVIRAGYRYACGALKRHQLPSSVYELVRIPVYRIDGIHALEKKLSYPEIPCEEYIKLKLISGLSVLTPVYQKLKKY
jgi:peptidoglycan/xylan/chitin deacetylase (PgdA/CDA1 family)